MDGILMSIKKMLGGCYEDDFFDPDIIMHINSVFQILTQLGVGPKEGFFIQGYEETWSDFTSDINTYMGVKSYVFMKVKLMFDPPQSSSVLQAYKEQIAELEWRFNIQYETQKEEA